MRVLYLTLQSTQQGQAGYAHVHEIVDGLRRREHCVELHQVAYSSPPPISRRIWVMLKTQVAAAARIRRADVVYVRWHFLTILTVFAARVLNRPVVVEVNGSYDDMYVAWPGLKRFSKSVELLMKWQLRLASTTICVTNELASWVREQGAQGWVEVISNGADTRRFRPGLPVSRLFSAEKPYVVFFGALSRWQGIPRILAAASHSRWPDGLNLVIAGEGADEALVRKAADSYPHVHYVGAIAYDDVGSLVANSVASLIMKEGDFTTGLMPLKLFESMACGVPVIVTDYPGMADVVNSVDAGFVIPPGDVDALLAVINILADSPERGPAMGRRGRTWVTRGHSWDARASDTSMCLSQMMKLQSQGYSH